MRERGDVTVTPIPSRPRREHGPEMFAPKPAPRATVPAVVLEPTSKVELMKGESAIVRWFWDKERQWSVPEVREGPLVIRRPRAARHGIIKIGPTQADGRLDLPPITDATYRRKKGPKKAR